MWFAGAAVCAAKSFEPCRAFRQELHFIARTRERFGIVLTPKRYRYWIRKVEDVLPGTVFLHQGDEPGRTIWTIRAGSQTLHVVYDETTGRLVTCFPPPPEHVLSRKKLLKLRARARFVDRDFLQKQKRITAKSTKHAKTRAADFSALSAFPAVT